MTPCGCDFGASYSKKLCNFTAACRLIASLIYLLFFLTVNRRLDEWVKLEQLDLDSVETVVDEKVEDKVMSELLKLGEVSLLLSLTTLLSYDLPGDRIKNDTSPKAED